MIIKYLSCGALKHLYLDSPDDLTNASKFFAETENAIRHGIDEHKVHNFLRQRRRCKYFIVNRAYWVVLWNLKERDHEEKEEYKKNSEAEEDPKEEEN